MKTILVTGGAGFFGGVMKRTLLLKGMRCVSIDICPDEEEHPNLVNKIVDIRSETELERIFREENLDGVVHCAAVLAHGNKNDEELHSCNVDGTRNVAQAMSRHGVRQLVFTSTNCLWGSGRPHPISEDEDPCPIESYGRSKLAAEKVIGEFPDLNAVIIRCPTILDAGRLGLLAILFEFIDEGRRIWAVGGGKNRYQFVCAQDLARACTLALTYPSPEMFHIGSDDVKTLAEVYQYSITRAGSKSSICALPRGPAVAAMKIAYALGLSPLGPYHYKMIAEDFIFDTTKIKRLLGWVPTRTNEEILWDAYRYYSANRTEIENRKNVSDHRRAADMGVIRLLKWMS